MATDRTPTASGRTRLGLPNKGKNPPIAHKDAEKAADKAHEQKTMKFATDKDLVNGLVESVGFHRDALNTELAVSLLFYAAHNEQTDEPVVKLPVKKGLRGIYEKAGYQCKDASGEDYKTVARRIGASAEFYRHQGGVETLRDWLADVQPRLQVEKLAERLAEYKFSGINAVLEYVGKPPVKGNRHPKLATPQPEAQATPAPPPHQLSDAGARGADRQPEGDDAKAAEGLDQDIEARRQDEESKRRDRRAEDNPDRAQVITKGKVKAVIAKDATPADIFDLIAELSALAAKLGHEQEQHQGEGDKGAQH